LGHILQHPIFLPKFYEVLVSICGYNVHWIYYLLLGWSIDNSTSDIDCSLSRFEGNGESLGVVILDFKFVKDGLILLWLEVEDFDAEGPADDEQFLQLFHWLEELLRNGDLVVDHVSCFGNCALEAQDLDKNRRWGWPCACDLHYYLNSLYNGYKE
jgi:hypothetical protein